MLIHTALDTFWATPPPPLQTLGDGTLFRDDPIPESVQDETDVCRKGDPEPPTADVCREAEML
jgi:hypothetical protein